MKIILEIISAIVVFGSAAVIILRILQSSGFLLGPQASAIQIFNKKGEPSQEKRLKS